MEADSAAARIPFCFMTGDLANADTRSFPENRGVPILPKPFSIRELLAFVARQVALPPAERQARLSRPVAARSRVL